MRQSGKTIVATFVKNGLMLIRITKNSEGIEHYLETGQKMGRELSRDELDRRVHLSGSLDAFSAAVEYTQGHKKWQDHYHHITASFAIEDNDLDDETLRKITDDLLDYYYCDYQKSDLIYACEAHRPLVQSEVNKSTGEVNQRLLHMHLAVSMLDVTTDNQVRMILYRHEVDKAFQSSLAAKYNLVDPANRRRETPQTKKNIIERWNSNKDTLSMQTKVAELRKMFSDVLDGVESIDEAKTLLKCLDIVASVEMKEQKSGNNYLQVKTTLDTKNINLRGKGFKALEALYYTPSELISREEIGKYKTADDRSNDEIVDQHKHWWLEQQSMRKPKKIDYQKIEDIYQENAKKRLKESRVYYVLYQHNIEEELIVGYRIWEKNNTRYLFNNDLGVKVYDNPNKITAQIPDDPDTRSRTVKLMLEMAASKGWDLKTLNVTGDVEFKNEVERQTKVIREVAAVKHDVRVPEPDSVPQARLSVSAIKQEAFEAKEQVAQRKFTKSEIDAIKIDLDSQAVIDYAITKYGLIGDHFSVVNGKISDGRTKAKPKNTIDFLTKNCNVPFAEALPMLQKMLDEQRERIPMQISLCYSSNPNGLGDWRVQQVNTFNELEKAVKSKPYSGVGQLVDGYRKAENVQSMSNLAIFDIDNDPGTPQLSIPAAKELLKDTTFMLVSSRSHQKVKDGKPAVDRYRVIVPLNKPLTPEKEHYRAEMALIAKKLGLIDFADPKALKDICRQYYKSPNDAAVIVNNTRTALNVDAVVRQATKQIDEQAEIKRKAKEDIINTVMPSVMADVDSDDFPFVIDVDAMNSLPLDDIYEIYVGEKLKQEGSYLMGKGITVGTSQSKQTFTVLQDGEQWLWHDFKSNESGNVLTFMRHMAGLNAFDAAKELGNKYGVTLIQDNKRYYAKALKSALNRASNDKSFKDGLKSITRATYVKIEKDTLKVGNKAFLLSDLGITKGEIIDQLKSNRESLYHRNSNDLER